MATVFALKDPLPGRETSIVCRARRLEVVERFPAALWRLSIR